MSLDVSLEIEVDVGNKDNEVIELFSSNITHNLVEIAEEAGIYKQLWRPEEIGAETAKNIIDDLKNGLKKLKNNPEYYKKFDSPNGWGTYEDFIPWLEEYLDACIRYPKAKISVSR